MKYITVVLLCTILPTSLFSQSRPKKEIKKLGSGPVIFIERAALERYLIFTALFACFFNVHFHKAGWTMNVQCSSAVWYMADRNILKA